MNKQNIYFLCNLGDLQQTVVGGRGERHIVISYNWGHQEVVKKIYESLKNENIKVWMNVDNMQGCIVDDMANAIEQADIVLVCYSSKYRNSYNCRAGMYCSLSEFKKHINIYMI